MNNNNFNKDNESNVTVNNITINNFNLNIDSGLLSKLLELTVTFAPALVEYFSK